MFENVHGPPDWESSTACSVSGLSRLPGVFLAPALALLLAALGADGGEGGAGDAGGAGGEPAARD